MLVLCFYKDSKLGHDACVILELFIKTIGVYTRSIIYPILFVLALEEVSKQVRIDGVWEMLYKDELVLTGDIRQEVEEMVVQWKETMEIKYLRVIKRRRN